MKQTEQLRCKVEAAAQWYALNREGRTRPVLPLLRERFGLSPLDAVKAAQRAHEIEREASHAGNR